MLRIPKDLRGMTFAQLSNKWGGSWKETMQRITKDRIDAREKEQEQEEAETRDKAMAEGDKGKRWVYCFHIRDCHIVTLLLAWLGINAHFLPRKRGTTHSVESTPIRGSKTGERFSSALPTPTKTP